MGKDERKEAFRNIFKRKGAEADSEVEQLKKKLDELGLPEEAQKIVDQEMKKLRNLDQRDKEYHVGLNYLTNIADLPWNISQKENHDPKHAR
jgi:ATP-dependent Lon protease